MGVSKGNVMRHLRLPESMHAYVEKFRAFYHRPTGTPKMMESNMARISRVKSFLHYMLIGQKRISDWKFIMNLPRLNQWLQDVTNSGKTITTVRYYIHNMIEFIDFMLGSKPPHSKLTHEQAREIRMFLEKARRNTSRDITIHSNRIKHEKMKKIPSIASIETCFKLAPAKIEELLGELEVNSSKTGTRYLLFGYLGAYLACLTGHRPSVFINLTDEDIDKAEEESTGEGILIRVSKSCMVHFNVLGLDVFFFLQMFTFLLSLVEVTLVKKKTFLLFFS
ncbi:uncharacterized protein LOC106535089, partial [Austrofundulus limnaeus]|uniref:Uncharacterized protein LOC106535089 n=1 Tax=Austrofundulus limnaeus TaxID=52670 RepID=A0A2I4D5A7_AUSLI